MKLKGKSIKPHTDEYKKAQSERLRGIFIGTLNVYDLQEKVVRRISKEEYQEYKNNRYLNLNSKRYRELERENVRRNKDKIR